MIPTEETPGAFAERQIVTCVVASRHARQYLEGAVTADDFGSVRYRRLFVAGMERQVVEPQESRVAALAEEAGCTEAELWLLLDADDRLCHVNAARFARRVVEAARQRDLRLKLADAHARLDSGASVEAVLRELQEVAA